MPQFQGKLFHQTQVKPNHCRIRNSAQNSCFILIFPLEPKTAKLMALQLQVPSRSPCVGSHCHYYTTSRMQLILQRLQPTHLHQWISEEKGDVFFPSLHFNLLAQTFVHSGRVQYLQPILYFSLASLTGQQVPLLPC